jgi:hypothetical protein
MIPTYYVLPDGYVFAETHDPQPDPMYPVITVWPYRYVAPEHAPAVQDALLRGETPRVPVYEGPREPPLPHDVPEDEPYPEGAVLDLNPLVVPPAGTLPEVPLRTGGPNQPSGTNAIPPDQRPDEKPQARPLWTHEQRLREETERIQRRLSGPAE